MTGEHHARASPRERGGRLSWPITSCVRRPCPTLDRARRREVRSRASVVVACSIALAARVFLPILCVLACVVRSLELGNADSGEFVPSAPVAHRLVKRARPAGGRRPGEALPENPERRAFRVTKTIPTNDAEIKEDDIITRLLEVEPYSLLQWGHPILWIINVINFLLALAIERINADDDQERADAHDTLKRVYCALLPKRLGAERGALALEIGMYASKAVATTMRKMLERPASDEELAPLIMAVSRITAWILETPECAGELAQQLTELWPLLEQNKGLSLGRRVKALEHLRGLLHQCDDESSLKKAVRTVTRSSYYTAFIRVLSVVIARQALDSEPANPGRVDGARTDAA
jgi:hypothetical protein